MVKEEDKEAVSIIRLAIFFKLSMTVGWAIFIVGIVRKAGWFTWNWNWSRMTLCLLLSAVIAAMVYDAAVCILRYRKLKALAEEADDGD